MELQGQGKTKRGVRLGANRLLTYKEGNDLPEHALKQELLRLETQRELVEIRYKREEAVIETLLYKIVNSIGDYVNLETRMDVHYELQRAIMKGLVSNRKKAENNPPTSITENGDTEDNANVVEVGKIETEVMKKIRRAEKRKQEKRRALRPVKPRPSYKALIEAENSNRKQINGESFIKLLESYGQEQDPTKIDLWLDCVYPERGRMSATICGIKKRLERYRNKVLMETDPRQYGQDWFLKESIVGNRFPEVLKFKSDVPHLPPINVNVNLISQTSASSSSTDSVRASTRPRQYSVGKLQKEPISAGEFLRGETPKRSQARSELRQGESNPEQIEKNCAGSDSDSEIVLDAITEVFDAQNNRRKSIINVADGEYKDGARGVSVVFLPELDSANVGTLQPESGAGLDSRRRGSTLGPVTISERRKSVMFQTEDSNAKLVEDLKIQMRKVARLKAEGREDEIDYESYFKQRRSLTLLMSEDDNLNFNNEEDFLKIWEDVQKCRYIRGYEPPEMRGLEDNQLGPFVFWKGEYIEEEEFIKKRKSKELMEQMEVENARQSNRNSLPDSSRRRSSVGRFEQIPIAAGGRRKSKVK